MPTMGAAGRDGRSAPNWGAPRIGGGAAPGRNANVEREMRETAMVVIDELSHIDAPDYDAANVRVTRYRPGPGGKIYDPPPRALRHAADHDPDG